MRGKLEVTIFCLVFSCLLACNSKPVDEPEDESDGVLTEYVSSPLDQAREVDEAHEERANRLNQALEDLGE